MRDHLKRIVNREKVLFPGRGRPTVDIFDVLEGVLYKLLADIPWSELPKCYPSYGTCYRHYKIWKSDKTLQLIIFTILVFQLDMEYHELKDIEPIFGKFRSHPPTDSETSFSSTLPPSNSPPPPPTSSPDT